MKSTTAAAAFEKVKFSSNVEIGGMMPALGFSSIPVWQTGLKVDQIFRGMLAPSRLLQLLAHTLETMKQ